MYDLCVIGAGVVGLSIAHHFQTTRNANVLIVEKETQPGQGISSRNSEVIHAGFYYPTGSLKAHLCVDGKHRLYHYLSAKNLPHRQCGKYLVTQPHQEVQLQALHDQGHNNGVDDLKIVPTKELLAHYPDLLPCPALWSPSTGILSVDALIHQLAGEFQAANGDLAVGTRLLGAEKISEGYRLTVGSGGDQMEVDALRVVNAAGLGALDVAESAGFTYKQQGYEIRFCKGSYFKVDGARGHFKHLIYPLPDPNSLGVHVRIDLQDEVSLGPNAEYLAHNDDDYTVSPALEADFRDHVRLYWPAVDQYEVHADWAGIRPHIFVRGNLYHDFHILDERHSGYPGWINLFGIDSPGLTSALAFGPYLGKKMFDI